MPEMDDEDLDYDPEAEDEEDEDEQDDLDEQEEDDDDLLPTAASSPRSPRGRLTGPQKVFAIRCRAEHMTPTDTLKALQRKFRKAENAAYLATLKPQNMEVYDASEPRMSYRLSQKLQKLFWQFRQMHYSEVERIPIANMAYRLWHLDQMIRNPDPDGPAPTLKLVLQVMAHAAKERGGMYQARQMGATDEEVADYVRERLHEMQAAIDKHVSSPEERNRVSEALKEAAEGRLESGGG